MWFKKIRNTGNYIILTGIYEIKTINTFKMFSNIAFMRIAKFLTSNFSTNCSDSIASLLQNGKVGDKIKIKVVRYNIG